MHWQIFLSTSSMPLIVLAVAERTCLCLVSLSGLFMLYTQPVQSNPLKLLIRNGSWRHVLRVLGLRCFIDRVYRHHNDQIHYASVRHHPSTLSTLHPTLHLGSTPYRFRWLGIFSWGFSKIFWNTLWQSKVTVSWKNLYFFRCERISMSGSLITIL